MKIIDFAKTVNTLGCNSKVADRLTAVYGKSIPESLVKILSYNEAGEFFDDDICRLMSLDEVANASKELGVDFVEAGIIPVLDVGDNCFVCFDLLTEGWLKYNIIDKISYGRKPTFEAMFTH